MSCRNCAAIPQSDPVSACHSIFRILLPGVAVLAAGCSATVNKRILPDQPARRLTCLPFGTPSEGSRVLPPAESARALAKWAWRDPERLCRASELILRQAHSRPVAGSAEASGFALMAARLADRALEEWGVPANQWMENPATRRALDAYNASVALFAEIEAEAILAGQPLRVLTPEGAATVAFAFDFPERYFDRLLPARRIAVKGFRDAVRTDGLGAALVGIRNKRPEREQEMELFPSSGVAVALNGRIAFDTGKPVFRLADSRREDIARIHGSAIPLAADYTAALAFSFGGENDLLVGIRNLLNVTVGTKDAGIYLTEPFDPRRIPVLVIHGLSSSPIVWRNLANEAMRDPQIRRNYQFLYAYYATGAPIMYSAAEIKKDVTAIRRRCRGSSERGIRELDVIGYSMGGVIARILVTDIGDRLWNEISDVPFDQVDFDPRDIPSLREDLFWKPVPGIHQVVFICTPHRGTRMADASYARFASWLIRLPGDFVQFQQRAFGSLQAALKGKSDLPSRVTGLDGLSAKSPLFRALDGVPLEKGVKYYSIIGDRGRGDSPDSSDGIVGYWSSHLDGAESELILPTGHDAQASPQCEAEIFRILRRGLRDPLTKGASQPVR